MISHPSGSDEGTCTGKARLSGQTPHWAPVAAVTFKSERNAVIQVALVQSQGSPQKSDMDEYSYLCPRATYLTCIGYSITFQTTERTVSWVLFQQIPDASAALRPSPLGRC